MEQEPSFLWSEWLLYSINSETVAPVKSIATKHIIGPTMEVENEMLNSATKVDSQSH